MSSGNAANAPRPSSPILIEQPRGRRTRPRSATESSLDSNSTDASSQAPTTPPDDAENLPGRSVSINIPPSGRPTKPSTGAGGPGVSPSTSPILSYFFPMTPKSPLPSPFASLSKSSTTPAVPAAETVFEDDEEDEDTEPTSPFGSSFHHRAASATTPGSIPWPTRFGPQQNTPATEAQQERGAGLLRRLSLGGGFIKGQPGRPVSPTPLNRRPGRSSTLAVPDPSNNKGPNVRSPSPMGERMLKGHFDGWL